MGVDLSLFTKWESMTVRRVAVDGMNILVGQLRFSRWGWRVAATNTIYKLLALLEAGVKPVFVYDGKPYALKG